MDTRSGNINKTPEDKTPSFDWKKFDVVQFLKEAQEIGRIIEEREKKENEQG